jgi:hypothetical protein
VIANPDNRRINGVHSLVGAIIRQAVLDHTSNYHEQAGEYPAYQFLYNAGLLPKVDEMFDCFELDKPIAYSHYVYLRDRRGWSFRRMAERLHMPVLDVRTAYHRAKECQ